MRTPRKCHVICCNDVIKFAIVDYSKSDKNTQAKRSAEAKQERLAEDHYEMFKKEGLGGTGETAYEEYRSGYFWHVHTVDVE